MLAISCTGIIAPSPVFQAIADQLAATVGVVGSVDLSSVFTLLGLPAPSQVLFEVVNNILFIRLDPGSNPPVSHMALDMGWFFFIDTAGMKQLVENFVSSTATPELVSNRFSPNRPNATWLVRPPASMRPVPHVDAAMTGQRDYLCGITVYCEAIFNIDFSLDS
jgi:hypothetical protein